MERLGACLAPASTQKPDEPQFYDWQTGGGTNDVLRLVESHPHLWDLLIDDLKRQLEPPRKPGEGTPG